MMPEATMVKITMKSMRAALVSNSQHKPTQRSRMQINRIILPVVITSSRNCLNRKDNDYFQIIVQYLPKTSNITRHLLLFSQQVAC